MKNLSDFELICELITKGNLHKAEPYNIDDIYKELLTRFRLHFGKNDAAWIDWALSEERFTAQEKEVFAELKKLREVKETYAQSWESPATNPVQQMSDYQLVVKLLYALHGFSRKAKPPSVESIYQEICRRADKELEHNGAAWIDWVLANGNCTQRQTEALTFMKKRLSDRSNRSLYAPLYDLIAAYSDE